MTRDDQLSVCARPRVQLVIEPPATGARGSHLASSQLAHADGVGRPKICIRGVDAWVLYGVFSPRVLVSLTLTTSDTLRLKVSIVILLDWL